MLMYVALKRYFPGSFIILKILFSLKLSAFRAVKQFRIFVTKLRDNKMTIFLKVHYNTPTHIGLP